MTNFLFRNTTTSVVTVVICIIVVSGQFAVSAVKNFTTKLVEEKAAWIEGIIVEEVPDNRLITDLLKPGVSYHPIGYSWHFIDICRMLCIYHI